MQKNEGESPAIQIVVKTHVSPTVAHAPAVAVNARWVLHQAMRAQYLVSGFGLRKPLQL
jgi:hypothetical protein